MSLFVVCCCVSCVLLVASRLFFVVWCLVHVVCWYLFVLFVKGCAFSLFVVWFRLCVCLLCVVCCLPFV